jgi:hypothetical protein
MTVAGKTTENRKISDVLSRNKQANCFEDRGAGFSASEYIY